MNSSNKSSSTDTSDPLVCGVNITCKNYAWAGGGNVQVQYFPGSREVDIFTPIGNGSGRFANGPGNIQGSIGRTPIECLGQNDSPTGWGLCFIP